MENTNRAANAASQNNWQNAETNESIGDPITQTNEIIGAEPREDTNDEHIHAMAGIDTPDPEDEEDDDDDDEDDEEEEEGENGDWGHVDPAESNSPFPDSNTPTTPGSAV